MNIALLGYGKMGKAIEEVAMARGHIIVATIDNEIDWKEKKDRLNIADVAIDFSTPDSILSNIDNCIEHNLPLVVGTTGWHTSVGKIKETIESQNQAFIWASNFSIGVNIFFKLNKELARLMNKYDDYQVSINEVHHSGKLDAPSGTAISIAKELIANLDRKTNWKLDDNNEFDAKIRSHKSDNGFESTINIHSERIDPVPGTHTTIFDSEIDTIEITHTAKNRKGFATGAVIAAEWLKDKKGFYDFKEVFF